MFSLQMADILAAAGGTVKDLAKALQTKLGNCAQPLEHRGPVTIDVTLPDKATTAALTVSNQFPGQATAFPGNLGGFSGKTPNGSNGFALNVPNGIAQFQGPIWPLFRPNWIKFGLIEDLPATPGATAEATVMAQQPDSANSIVGTTVTITNEIGYWSGSIGDAGEASIWYTDLTNDVYEWRPRVIKTAPETFEPVADDSSATCTEASCKPYYFTLGPIAGLGSGGTCEELNGQTLLLTYSSACVWKIDGLARGGTCGFDEVRLTVTDSGANKLLTVTFYNASNTLQATAVATVAAPTTVDLCSDTWANTDFVWTTAGPPPVVTAPPTMTLTPYVPPFYSSGICGCPANKVPNSYTLTISGSANGTCDGCANWDGTYTLVSDGACGYNANPDISSGSGACASAPYWLDYLRFLPAIGELSIYGNYGGTFHAKVFFTAPSEICWGWSEEAHTSVTDYSGRCDLSGATITISVNF